MFLARWKLIRAIAIAGSLIASALACPQVTLAASTERLEAQIESYRSAQERELASPTPARGSTSVAHDAAESYIRRAYGSVLSGLRLQLLAPGNASGPHSRVIREQIENYELERQIAFANSQAIARARERLYPSKTVLAPAVAPKPIPKAIESTDPMLVANRCLEAGTCRPAPTLGSEPASASASASANGLTPSESYTSTAAASAPAIVRETESLASTQVSAPPAEQAPAADTYPAVEVKLTPSDDATSPGAPIFTGEAQ